MQLVLNESNEIVAYALIGEIEGAVSYELLLPRQFDRLRSDDGRDDEYLYGLPPNFEADFKPLYFSLIDDRIILNQNYIEPIEEQNNEALTLAELTEMVAEMYLATNLNGGE
ncbi:DUF2977 domain-containing protein [Brochothrix campestris]|uniref:Uncharacterized protein n=1 Tax=Brochothrix campestris FSL F6-1037 TaxID=1265861 RepID=W7CZ03_9LIST|nr:DUF2977 domain-containing protein [Brochothrix campestris]EUJ41985.1 hypothetical protein BCAMP_01230 [Brochothrix campestris FSL F6-1037]